MHIYIINIQKIGKQTTVYSNYIIYTKNIKHL